MLINAFIGIIKLMSHCISTKRRLIRFRICMLLDFSLSFLHHILKSFWNLLIRWNLRWELLIFVIIFHVHKLDIVSIWHMKIWCKFIFRLKLRRFFSVILKFISCYWWSIRCMWQSTCNFFASWNSHPTMSY